MLGGVCSDIRAQEPGEPLDEKRFDGGEAGTDDGEVDLDNTPVRDSGHVVGDIHRAIESAEKDDSGYRKDADASVVEVNDRSRSPR